MSPPLLAANAPILDIAHPREINILILFGHEFDITILNRSNRRFGKRFDFYKPLISEEWFDDRYDELLKSGDEDLSPVFFLVFMVLFNLLLLNMFIAIISQHYEKIHEEIKKKEDT